MYQYSLYGQNILSEMEFPQLYMQNSNEKSDILICEGGVPNEILRKAQTQYYEIGESESWFQNSTGVFYVAFGSEIHYMLREDANIQYAQTYILGHGISMLLLQKGIMTIHCSGIAGEQGAYLIAGQSGAGKSTMTTQYLNEGYQLVADDIVAVKRNEEGTVIAYPAFPYQKLCRDVIQRESIDTTDSVYIDEEKDKFLVSRKAQFKNQPEELKAIVLLGIHDGDELFVKELIGVDKLIAIRQNLFLKRFEGAWQMKPTTVKRCLEIGSNIPIYMVSRPRKKDTVHTIKMQVDKLIQRHM